MPGVRRRPAGRNILQPRGGTAGAAEKTATAQYPAGCGRFTAAPRLLNTYQGFRDR
jgi:hypothetical protein